MKNLAPSCYLLRLAIQFLQPLLFTSQVFFFGEKIVGGRVMGSKEALFLKENRKKQRPGGGFIFFFNLITPTWGNDPIWLIFFNWVETQTTN